MIRPSPLRRARLRKRFAFTLIELLTVIAIILVLAGLLIYVAGGSQYKASCARAQAEITAMSAALENYKADNGAYPRPSPAGSSSDSLNAQSSPPPDPGAAPGMALYQSAGQLLFQALSGTPVTGTTYGKSYMTFKLSQLSDVSGGQLAATTTPTGITLIVDPFGIPYGYSTAAQYAVDTANNSTATPAPTPDPTQGYNPTFDLWSTAGYSSTGKSYPTLATGTNQNTVWVKNW